MQISMISSIQLHGSDMFSWRYSLVSGYTLWICMLLSIWKSSRVLDKLLLSFLCITIWRTRLIPEFAFTCSLLHRRGGLQKIEWYVLAWCSASLDISADHLPAYPAAFIRQSPLPVLQLFQLLDLGQKFVLLYSYLSSLYQGADHQSVCFLDFRI